MTRDAEADSLLRHALAVTGSCFAPDLRRRINTQVVNVAARGIRGHSRSARIESLHFAGGATAAYKSYVKHCAEFLGARLRAGKSSINRRTREELRHYFNAPSFETRDIQK